LENFTRHNVARGYLKAQAQQRGVMRRIGVLVNNVETDREFQGWIAASGQAAAAPPMSVMNSRRLLIRSLSSDLGQLAVSRHLTCGIDCATAVAAAADAAIPVAVTLRNSRRFMGY